MKTTTKKPAKKVELPKKENTTVTVTHEYPLTQEDLKNLEASPFITIKTQICMKEKPTIISNRGDMSIKKRETIKKKK